MRLHLRPLLGGLVLTAAVGLGADAAAAPGLTGTARFQVSSGGARPAASHLHFELPAAYAQVVGALEGNPAIGRYRRHVTAPAGTRCDVELNASGRAYRKRPALRGGVLTIVETRVHVRRSGRRGAISWYVGVARDDAVVTVGGDRRVGVAVFRAPSRYRTAAAPWAVAQLSLEAYPSGGSTVGAQGRRDCERVRDAADGELGREARSMRVVGGRAHGTSGARVEPAAVRTSSTTRAS